MEVEKGDYTYDGMVLPYEAIKPETIDFIKGSLKIGTEDVIIASYPRSG